MVTVFLVLFFAKDKLNCFVTNYHLRNNNIVVSQSDSIRFFKQFNNSSNNNNFDLSLVELGGFGCKPCIRMDTVLMEIKNIYKERVNIKVYRVTDKENRKIAKYFGISAIPTQIIMDKNSKEVFRHTGFLSTEELNKILTQKGVKQQ